MYNVNFQMAVRNFITWTFKSFLIGLQEWVPDRKEWEQMYVGSEI